ncbi:putative glycosyl transferase [Serinicoccus hydrothermalis]|uniref:Putative glycosyl transferase n=1 Tax=Serinicoccus hydrothermalis TaxID=1758689 RepID=A0A1B1NCY2_9MICO|nr:glycosyltransferase family 2 protein [Serinicoccus hydrothermalis]ANS79299.1 putative glycosyl transferase [Serinicoccus hydrothermalis]
MISQSTDPSQAWLAWQLRHGAGAVDPVPLFHQTLRTRSAAGLDALADLATQGRHSPGTLLEEVLATGGPPDAALHPARRRALAGVAFAWAGMLRTERELLASALVFEALWPGDGLTWLGPQLRLTGLQTLFLAGRHEQLAALLPGVEGLHPDAEHYLRVDLANPHGPATSTADAGRWEDLLAQRFTERGLAAPALRDATADGPAPRSPFDRLGAPGARPGTAGGELVTVIMPCWRPDEGLVTAVRSISEQTYADLEIVVVDDCSGPGYEEIFARAAALDERVRVLPMARNGGSYLGRAAAIEASRGSLITFQDADDWSHPSRIELQVAALQEAGPQTPMTRSRAVRAKDDLTHQWLGYRAVRENASSLLLRRSILPRTGGFAPIRKGADSEFAERVARLHGAIVDVGEPLAVTRLRAGSLSRGDFTFSWTAPERRAFRSSFMVWHRRLARRRREEEAPVLVQDAELAALPFPVPAAWVRDLPTAEHVPTRLGTAYLGSFSRPHGSRGGAWLRQELRGVSPGEPVGLWHQDLRATTEMRRPELDRGFDDPLLDRQAWLLSRLDRVTVDRLVVLDPSVLALMRDQEVRVDVGTVEVWLAPEDVSPGSSGLPEDLLGASDLVASWWSVRPRWASAPWLDEAERTLVRGALPGLDVVPALTGQGAGVG